MKASTLITGSLLKRWPLPKPNGALGKDDRGRVLAVGGSREMPGAVILAAVGALRAGAGRLEIATGENIAAAVGIAVPEARVIGLAESRSGEIAPSGCSRIHEEVRRCNALVIGPGMVDPRAALSLLRHCAKQAPKTALVVDAGALAVFHRRQILARAHDGGIAATPHAGEMAQLWGVSRDEVLASPLELAREAAARLDVVIALKGARTYVAAPDGQVFHNTAGNVGLGTSGSGDMLSGVIAGLAARGADALQATIWGVYLHARAGDALARKMGLLGYLARELLDEIPPLLAKFA